MKALVVSAHFQANSYGMTLKQKLFIAHLAEELGYSDDHLENYLHKYFKQSLATLDRKQASNVIAAMKHILSQRG
jgi:hypothetical protein